MDNSRAKRHLKKVAQSLKTLVPKSAYRHELTAAYFGYKTKASLQADLNDGMFPLNFDIGDPDSFVSRVNYPGDKVESRMRDLGLENSEHLSEVITEVIEKTILPNCTCCGDDFVITLPLNKDGLTIERTSWHELPEDPEEANELIREEDKLEMELLKQEWLCSDCSQNPDLAVRCQLCDDDLIYHPAIVDRHGLCPTHYGEFEYSEEELEDLESYAEYIGNH